MTPHTLAVVFFCIFMFCFDLFCLLVVLLEAGVLVICISDYLFEMVFDQCGGYSQLDSL